jgi:hypothetical protein
MDTQQIVAALREERDRLEQAIAALEGGGVGRGRRGRRPGPVPGGPGRGRGRRRRRLSAAAKQRISEMMKKRWAERKKAARA